MPKTSKLGTLLSTHIPIPTYPHRSFSFFSYVTLLSFISLFYYSFSPSFQFSLSNYEL